MGLVKPSMGKLLRFFGLLLPPLFISASALLSEPTPPTEYEVKAAYLYNFAKFVEWPQAVMDKAGETFVVGILGNDPFGNTFHQQFNGKVIHGKTLVFRKLSHLHQATRCQIVFVDASEDERWN
jgi:hypothetical protein